MLVNEPEENYKTGYINIYRSIKKHWIWQDATKLKWWMDILLEVNHKPNKVNIKYELFECNRGQSVKSLETWAKEWRTDKTTVKRFFDLLQRDKMIFVENLKKTTRITVCKYDSYNVMRNADETLMKRNAFSDETRRITNKHVKHDKHDKKGISATPSDEMTRFNAWVNNNASRVLGLKEQLTEIQLQQLFSKYTKSEICDTLINMHNWEPLLRKNISVYYTILKWIAKDAKGN